MGRKSREKAERRERKQGDRDAVIERDAATNASETDSDAAQSPEGDVAEIAGAAESAAVPGRFGTFVARWRGLGVDVLLFAAALIPYLVMKAYSATPVSGDENIYLYVGQRIAEGASPYTQVFFAHPPGHLLAAGFWMALGDYSPAWAKLAAIVPAALTIALVAAMLRARQIGRVATVIAVLTLGLSYNFLSVSSHFTGANWSMLWFAGGLFATAFSRRYLGGALMALGLLTSAHLAPAVLGVVAVDCAFHWRQGWKTLLGFGLVFGGVHALCVLGFGDPYFDQVFGYHLMKTPMNRSGMSAVTRFFWNEYHLAAVGVLGILLWGWRFLTQLGGRVFSLLLRTGLVLIAVAQAIEAAMHELTGPRVVVIVMAGGGAALWTVWTRIQQTDKAREPIRTDPLFLLASAAAVAQTLGVLTVDRVFTYYLAPLLPLFAILSAGFIDHGFAWLKASWRVRRDIEAVVIRGGVLLAVFLFLGISFILGEKLEGELGYYPQQLGQRFDYDWRDSPVLPGFANAAVKALVYEKNRRIGDWHPGLRLYLWHEVRTEDPSVLLPFFEPYADKAGTVFGDASTAGYYALATGRKVALDLADTNAQLFKSGLIDMGDLIARLDAAPPLFVVLNPSRGIAQHPEFKQWVRRYYRLIARETTTGQATLFLMVRE